jgi:hypothetical protein
MCMYKGVEFKSNCNTLGCDRAQHDRPATCVVAPSLIARFSKILLPRFLSFLNIKIALILNYLS